MISSAVGTVSDLWPGERAKLDFVFRLIGLSYAQATGLSVRDGCLAMDRPFAF